MEGLKRSGSRLANRFEQGRIRSLASSVKLLLRTRPAAVLAKALLYL